MTHWYKMFYFLDSLALMKNRCKAAGEMLRGAAPQHVLLPKPCLDTCSFALPFVKGCALYLPNNAQITLCKASSTKSAVHRKGKGVHSSFAVFSNVLGCAGGLHINKWNQSSSLFGCFQCGIRTSHQKWDFFNLHLLLIHLFFSYPLKMVNNLHQGLPHPTLGI